MASSSLQTAATPDRDAAPAPPAPPRPAVSPAAVRPGWREFLRQGAPGIWFTGLMVVIIVCMLIGMVVLILANGLGHFWADRLVQVQTEEGAWLGPIADREPGPDGGAAGGRLLVKIGNRDLHGLDFRWFDAAAVQAQTEPADAVVVERREHGNFHGFLRRVAHGERVVAEGDAAWDAFRREARAARRDHRRLLDVEAEYESQRRPLSRLEAELEKLQRTVRAPDAAQRARLQQLETGVAAARTRLEPRLQPLDAERNRLIEDLASRHAVFVTADGRDKDIQLDAVVRAYRPNAMSVWERIGLYGARLREFVFAAPRESNTEGGIFPALFGTVLMVLLMTVAVVPLGVMAALYLHEYAKQGPVLRAVRLAVNNLAGVPSIVFGMFGLAFFVYGVGGFIDRTFYTEALPNPTFGTGGILWASLTLALLTLPVVIVATEEGLSAVPRANREGSLALGATQWQTLLHVVLPNAVPGILTGLILAVSRGAGEVAPLMITGVVKLAPDLALDGSFPFLHLERKFMHLGFHIYDVSMQSPNVEAAKPMVYTTTLLLLVLVVALNTSAIVVRNRMRRRYRGAAL
jgi:phosphate transport system permease protein